MSEFKRTYRIDRLYFRYLKNTELGKNMDLDTLVNYLVNENLITLTQNGTRYSELTSFEKSSDQNQVVRKILNNLKMVGTLVLVLCLGCSSAPKTYRIELPVALRETFRGGQVQGLESPTNAPNGLFPSAYDQTQHVCVSSPVYSLEGIVVRTDVSCW